MSLRSCWCLTNCVSVCQNTEDVSGSNLLSHRLPLIRAICCSVQVTAGKGVMTTTKLFFVTPQASVCESVSNRRRRLCVQLCTEVHRVTRNTAMYECGIICLLQCRELITSRRGEVDLPTARYRHEWSSCGMVLPSPCYVWCWHSCQFMLFVVQLASHLIGRQEGHSACKKTGCWFVGGDNLTGALHVLQLQLSPPSPSSLAPIKSRMETFWYLLTQVHVQNGR